MRKDRENRKTLTGNCWGLVLLAAVLVMWLAAEGAVSELGTEDGVALLAGAMVAPDEVPLCAEVTMELEAELVVTDEVSLLVGDEAPW